VTLYLRAQPGGRQYRLPKGEEAGEVTKALAETLGSRGCVVIGYDIPGRPRANAVVVLNGNVVESVELVDLPDDEPEP